MSRRRRVITWSRLPVELLPLIADRLATQCDTWNFRLVCKEWHASTSLCTRRPQNILSPILPSTIGANNTYNFKNVSLVPCSIFLVRPLANTESPPWLCIAEEARPGRLYLRHQSSYSYDFRHFRSSNYRVKELGRFCTIKSTGYGLVKSKVVLICDQNCETSPGIEDYNAITYNAEGMLDLIMIKHRAMFRITGPNNVIRKYDDVVYFKGGIFAIDCHGIGYTLDYYYESNLHIIVPRPMGVGTRANTKKRLVVSDTGELYLVYICPPRAKTPTFKVYKLNENTGRWNSVDGVGVDKILITTPDICFFAITKDFPRWTGNCVVFCRNDFSETDKVDFGGDLSMFTRGNDSEDSFERLVYNFKDDDCTRLRSYSGYSSLFWPPPTWVSKNAGASTTLGR